MMTTLACTRDAPETLQFASQNRWLVAAVSRPLARLRHYATPRLTGKWRTGPMRPVPERRKAKSDVLNLEDFEVAGATGGRDFEGIAHRLAYHGAGNRGGNRDTALAGIRFRIADQLVG